MEDPDIKEFGNVIAAGNYELSVTAHDENSWTTATYILKVQDSIKNITIPFSTIAIQRPVDYESNLYLPLL